MSLPTLVTIPLSHYCEKARWALDRAGIAYVESAHPPFLHMAATLRGPGRTTPQLRLDGEVLSDSRAIVRWVERTKPTGLIPSEPALAAEAEAFEARCDSAFGPAVRRFAYHHLLDRMDLLHRMFVHGARPLKRAVFWAITPVVPAAMRKAMRIDEAGAARSLAAIEACFDEADALLARGGRYLVGDTFTVADLTFAALGAPMVAPAGHPVAMPPLEALPPKLAGAVRGFRARPSGQLITRLYAEAR